MTTSKKFRRDRLLRLARAGKLVAVESYHYDDMHGQSMPNHYKPVHVMEGGKHKDGSFNVHESDFRSKSGSCWLNPSGNVTLYVHSNCNYTFKILP